MRIILPALLALTATSAFAQSATQPVNANTPVGQVVQAAPAAAGFGLAKVFDEADTNRDNVVTKEEFLAKAERHFGMADTNKDGKITREEMQTQQNAVMQQMQKNLFGGNGGNWQGKLNEFLGSGAAGTTNAVPTTPVITSPSAPVVIPPSAPTAPTTY